MSNWHILEQNRASRKLNVVFHIPVPVENNDANPAVSLRAALAESIKPRKDDGTYGVFQSVLTTISPSELVQLQNGELLEVVSTISYLAGQGNVAKRQKVSDRYDAMVINKIAGLRAKFKLYGDE